MSGPSGLDPASADAHFLVLYRDFHTLCYQSGMGCSRPSRPGAGRRTGGVPPTPGRSPGFPGPIARSRLLPHRRPESGDPDPQEATGEVCGSRATSGGAGERRGDRLPGSRRTPIASRDRAAFPRGPPSPSGSGLPTLSWGGILLAGGRRGTGREQEGGREAAGEVGEGPAAISGGGGEMGG